MGNTNARRSTGRRRLDARDAWVGAHTKLARSMETVMNLRFLRRAIGFAAVLNFAGAGLLACGADDSGGHAGTGGGGSGGQAGVGGAGTNGAAGSGTNGGSTSGSDASAGSGGQAGTGSGGTNGGFDAGGGEATGMDAGREPPRFNISITKTEDVAGTFGSVGAYERITGTFTGEVDPKDSKNAIIQDLDLAPLNANGKVEYRSDFVMFKPKDMSKANGVLRYDAPNRGNLVNLDSYFASRGYVFLTAAWQGDVPADGRLTLTVPIAKGPNGTTITGPYRSELIPAATTVNSLSLPGGAFNGSMMPYAPASLDNTLPGYRLTRRINEADPRELIVASDWKFAKCDATTPFPGTPDGAQVCLKNGFDGRYFYELVYNAKDPKVMGLGFAAVRDMVAFFHHKQTDAAGTANPISSAIKYTIGSGVSQCGNFMRTFVHLGFNQDLEGKQVFDGIYAQIAARQNNLNMRFAVPGGGGGVRTDHTAFGQGGTRGLDPSYVDAVSGRSDGGILKRCDATKTCPKLFVGFSSSEFWVLQGSPLLTDAYGTVDLVQPANARIYFYSGTQHSLAAPSSPPASAGSLYATNNNVAVSTVIRALYQDLEDWVVAGKAPPDSQVPKLSNATLVRPSQVNFPAIPGVTYKALANGYELLDWGSQYKPQDETGIATQLPPAYLGRDYAILVPQVDADGNDIAGIRSLDVAAGLGTNTGWNYTSKPGVIDSAGLYGSWFPYVKTKAARMTAGDPRLSLEERYVTQAGYVAAVTKAANDLVAQRFMLKADADAAIAAAMARQVLPQAQAAAQTGLFGLPNRLPLSGPSAVPYRALVHGARCRIRRRWACAVDAAAKLSPRRTLRSWERPAAREAHERATMHPLGMAWGSRRFRHRTRNGRRSPSPRKGQGERAD
jgi:hypothetical protein